MYMQGKKGVIMGVANNLSIAFDIAKSLEKAGAEIIYSYLPDEPGKDRNLKKVEHTLKDLHPRGLVPVNATKSEDLARMAEYCQEKFGKIDFILHSIAFAPLEDIQKSSLLYSSKNGFLQSMESSVYTLIESTRVLAPLMNEKCSVLTLSYLGSERSIEGYNLMGVAKAALESAVRYLAMELGPRGVRVNSLSAGAKKTLSSAVLKGVADGLKATEKSAPLRRNVNSDDLGGAGLFLLSELSSGVTGENLYVDCGVHMMGFKGDKDA